jgi:hypothetical protein
MFRVEGIEYNVEEHQKYIYIYIGYIVSRRVENILYIFSNERS